MAGNSVLEMTEKVFDLALRLVQVRMAHFHDSRTLAVL